MRFAVINLVWFTVRVVLNLPGMPTQFDPFPFSFLTMTVSLEAIFLAVFVLISENVTARRDDRRARLEMQVNIITEREVTALVRLVAELHEHLGLPESQDPELRDMMAKTRIRRIASVVEVAQEEAEKRG